MSTLEEVTRLWEWFVLRFCRVLDEHVIANGYDFIADITNSCVKKKKEDPATPLTPGASKLLLSLNEYLGRQHELFEGYFA
ncbi:MAG: hypothetical protein AAB877_03745 [Patescibacteria group bacterium]